MHPQIVVVGAGVIGCSLAHELTLAGAKVVVLDAASFGGAVSPNGFPWVNANIPASKEYARLKRWGIEAHERMQRAQTVIQSAWFHQTGNLEIAAQESEMGLIANKVAKLVDDGYSAKLLSVNEIRGLEPFLDITHLVGGALYPQEGWVDTTAMCATLLNAAQVRGAKFHPYRRVTRVAPQSVACVSPSGEEQRYSPDLIVLAAGNGNRRILEAGGHDHPLLDAVRSDKLTNSYAGVGIVGRTVAVPRTITRVVQAPGIAMSPARNGGVLLTNPSIGAAWYDDRRIGDAPGELLRRARGFVPSLQEVEIETLSASVRVLPRDGLPIADWLDATHTIYTVATHSGITLAPVLAELVCQELVTGRRHAALQAFGLDRFNN